MRSWYWPLTVLGLSGLGLLLSTEKGKNAARRAWDVLENAPERMQGWNDSIENELENIQQTLNSLATALETEQTQAVR
jgi:hypothetical protein